MSGELEIDVRLARLPHRFTLRIPGPFSLESDVLDRAMALCNRELGDPQRDIRGPAPPKSS